MTDDIWTILQLAPTKDKKEIQAAFAKRSREFHPEEHPEVFLALKNAYRSAIAYAERTEGSKWWPDTQEIYIPGRAKETALSQTLALAWEVRQPDLTKWEQEATEKAVHALRIILQNERYRNHLRIWRDGFLPYLRTMVRGARNDDFNPEPIGADIAGVILDEITQAPVLPVEILELIKKTFLKRSKKDPALRPVLERLDRMLAQARSAGVPLCKEFIPVGEARAIFDGKYYERGAGYRVLKRTVAIVILLLVPLYILELGCPRPARVRQRNYDYTASEYVRSEVRRDLTMIDKQSDAYQTALRELEYLNAISEEATFEHNETQFYIWYYETEQTVYVSDRDATEQNGLVRYGYLTMEEYRSLYGSDGIWTLKEFLGSFPSAIGTIRDIEKKLGYNYLERR